MLILLLLLLLLHTGPGSHGGVLVAQWNLYAHARRLWSFLLECVLKWFNWNYQHSLMSCPYSRRVALGIIRLDSILAKFETHIVYFPSTLFKIWSKLIFYLAITTGRSALNHCACMITEQKQNVATVNSWICKTPPGLFSKMFIITRSVTTDVVLYPAVVLGSVFVIPRWALEM